jgi:hypothetical protein
MGDSLVQLYLLALATMNPFVRKPPPGNSHPGPLTGGNEALPWIIFGRNRSKFAGEFPEWQIKKIAQGIPFRYLISGGISLISLNPAWTFGLWECLEKLLKPLMKHLAMFAQVELVRTYSILNREQPGLREKKRVSI